MVLRDFLLFTATAVRGDAKAAAAAAAGMGAA